MSNTNTLEEQVNAQIESLINSYKNPDQGIFSQKFTLFPNYVETDLGGIKKAISLLDFKAIIDNLLQVEQKLTQISLPFNCFSFSKSSTEIHLSCYYPERIVKVTHLPHTSKNGVNYTIPFPNTIISTKLSLQDGFWVVYGTKFFCTNKKVTQLPENEILWNSNYPNGIWSIPFPNFYSSGDMCYGRNTMPSKFNNNLRGLDYYYQVIFESAFNDDLGINSVKTSITPTNWFKKLSSLTSFPYNELR